MEALTCNRLLPQLDGKTNLRQYARKGHLTTDALLYMLQVICEAVESGDAGATFFSPVSLKTLISSIITYLCMSWENCRFILHSLAGLLRF